MFRQQCSKCCECEVDRFLRFAIVSCPADVCIGESRRASGLCADAGECLRILSRYYCWCFPGTGSAGAAPLLSEWRIILWGPRNEYKQGHVPFCTSVSRYGVKDTKHWIRETQSENTMRYSIWYELIISWCFSIGLVHVKLRAWNIFSLLEVDMFTFAGKNSAPKPNGHGYMRPVSLFLYSAYTSILYIGGK